MTLKAIKNIPKTGDEKFVIDSKYIGYNLRDFWKWSVSDLLSNAARGRLAEFIVGTAMGIDASDVRDEWDAYDLLSPEGIKIEVKSAAYVQTWEQTNYSKISFSIKPAKAWDKEIDKRAFDARRPADVYVFCLLNHKDQNTIDPMKLEQWEFYVVPISTLNEYGLKQAQISLNPLRKLGTSVNYENLNEAINAAYIEQVNSVSLMK